MAAPLPSCRQACQRSRPSTPLSTFSPGGTSPPSAGSARLCATPSPLTPTSTSAPSTTPPSTSETSCWPRASCPPTPSQVRSASSAAADALGQGLGGGGSPTAALRTWRLLVPELVHRPPPRPRETQGSPQPSVPRKMVLPGLYAGHGVLWPGCQWQARDGTSARGRPGHLRPAVGGLPVGCAVQLVSRGSRPVALHGCGRASGRADLPCCARRTLEEAASVPVVYSTAYYSLIVRGRMQRGETVLIHSGSGGVGQAAIAIALSLGCRVFTTVGKPAGARGSLGLPTPAPRPGSAARASPCQGPPRSGRISRPGSPSSARPALPTPGTRPSNSTCYGTRPGRVSGGPSTPTPRLLPGPGQGPGLDLGPVVTSPTPAPRCRPGSELSGGGEAAGQRALPGHAWPLPGDRQIRPFQQPPAG